MNLMCRTCMQINIKYVSIFDYHVNGKMLSDMLVECATINIHKDDGLPLYICNYCLEKLSSAWDFRVMIIETDSKLRNIFKKRMKVNVVQNCNLFTDSTVVKEESAVVKSEICSLLIQENVNTNNWREDQSLEIISSANNDNANFSGHKIKQKRANKILVKNVPNDNYLDKSSHIFACEDSTAITEITVQEKENNTTIDNQTNIACNGNVKQNVVSNLLYSADCKCGGKTLTNESNGRNCVSNEDITSIKVIQKAETEKQVDSLQDTSSENNSLELEDEDEMMLEDNAQYNSDESVNNFNVSTENIINSEKVNKKLTNKEKDKMSVFCKTCNRTFGYRYYFEVHEKNHTGDKKWKCNICGKAFVRQFQLRLHMVVHSDERPYSCETCGKTFKYLTVLYSHKKIHSDYTPHTCSICQKSFRNKYLLNLHIQRHKNEKRYTCEVCGKSYSDVSALYKHKHTHVNAKKFACPSCGKTFLTNIQMRSHLKLHSDARPHLCSYCSKSFKTKDVLDTHILIHTGEKPYSCKICDKSFRQSSALYNHMRIHTGETPYACELCPSKFKYSHHLQNHMKVHK